MRDHERDVVDRHRRLLQGTLGRIHHDAHGAPEGLLAVHLDRAAVLAGDEVHERAVGPDVEAEQVAAVLGRLEHDRAGAVTEEHRHGAVVPVHPPRQVLGSDEQDPLRACREQAPGEPQAVHEAAARRVEVDRRALGTEGVLDERRGRGDQAVRRRRGEEDRVDRAWLDVGPVERGPRGGKAERRGAAADTSLPDAGPLGDPLVGRVQGARQLVVGHHPVGQPHAPAGHSEARHGLPLVTATTSRA